MNSKKSVMRIRIDFNADPDPAFLVNADPDPGGSDDQKLEKFCSWKVEVEVFTPQKRTSDTSKLEFSWPSWIRILIPNADQCPDPADQNECGSVWIRIRNTGEKSFLNHFLSLSQVYAAYETGLAHGTSVRIKVTTATTAREVVDLVIKQLNMAVILKAVLRILFDFWIRDPE
jgi:hypothetical protein